MTIIQPKMDPLSFDAKFQSLANYDGRFQVLDTNLKSVSRIQVFFEKMISKLLEYFPNLFGENVSELFGDYDKSHVIEALENFFSEENIEYLNSQDKATLTKAYKMMGKLQESFAKGTETLIRNVPDQQNR